MPNKLPARNYETLDAIVVVASLVMVSGLGAGLLLIPTIPADRLPIIASLVTAVLAIPALYGTYRWGTNVGAKQAQEAAADTTKAATTALAAIASQAPPAPQKVEVVNDPENPVPVEEPKA